ncbi:hypothetical protein HUT18_11650 [Streptomyces sp. NA04227]|uniref:hypothetical protein n=1 Tax=Streptomyces sp. NA04227 TaxID=2742136 RepID=UPI0015919C0F|nr:hypothetical protein [Streptomyces sp. NA04227]QKW06952.1 hypothetical protein HUT18_11650 [Streptomyces sp. NA04227]
MATHGSQNRAYPLPDGRELSRAVDKAIRELYAAQQRAGRAMTVVAAATVRDILTGCDHDAPFDAAWAEFTETWSGSLFATGAYWMAAGERRTFVDDLGQTEGMNAVLDMNEWTSYLDDTNREVWEPISERLPDRDGTRVWRLDLGKAAALSLP